MFDPCKPGVVDRLRELSADFPKYLHAFNADPPFRTEQLRSHLKTLEIRRRFSKPSDAARDVEFTESLYETLQLWCIGTRGFSEPVPLPKFRREFNAVAFALELLETTARIDGLELDVPNVARSLWRIIGDLDIVLHDGFPTQSKIVSGTKALHHLMPELVFPIDREYTQTFFGWNGNSFQNRGRECFGYAFEQFAALARAVSPQQYVGAGWNSSVSKVLDNAVVGFCRLHGLKSDNKRYREKQQRLAEVYRILVKAGLSPEL